MVKLLIISFVLIILIKLIIGKDNFYELIILFGKKGSGKSTHIAKMAYQYQKKGYKVYSNIDVSGCYIYDPKDIGEYTFEPNSVVFCDEIGIIWNNRNYKEFKDCVIQWFKYQRKYKIRMYAYSQSPDDFDITLRRLIDRLFIVKRIGNISIQIPVLNIIDVGHDHEGHGQIITNYKKAFFTSWKLTYLPRYYGLFESFDAPSLDLIEATYCDYNDISELYKSNKLWLIYQLELFKANIILKLRSISIFNKIFGYEDEPPHL